MWYLLNIFINVCLTQILNMSVQQGVPSLVIKIIFLISFEIIFQKSNSCMLTPTLEILELIDTLILSVFLTSPAVWYARIIQHKSDENDSAKLCLAEMNKMGIMRLLLTVWNLVAQLF